METKRINLFLVEDDPKQGADLRAYLSEKFGEKILITNFFNGESALRKLDETTSIVILDNQIERENSNDVLVSIKKKSPETQVIILSSKENMEKAVDSFYKGATEFIIKDEKTNSQLVKGIQKIFRFPVNILVQEFKVSKYFAIFILVFVVVGFSLLALNFI